MSKPAVFLDRDGTINEEVHHLTEIGQLRLLEGVGRAIKLFNEAGWPVVVVTNQSVVARGMLSEASLAAIHQALQARLEACGARVDAIYYCPHHPTAGNGSYGVACDCRKPQPGLLRQAAGELDLDLARSYLVGDKLSDIAAGRAAGCATVLVRTGYGRQAESEAARQGIRPDHVVDTLLDAAQWIAKQETPA